MNLSAADCRVSPFVASPSGTSGPKPALRLVSKVGFGGMLFSIALLSLGVAEPGASGLQSTEDAWWPMAPLALAQRHKQGDPLRCGLQAAWPRKAYT